MTRRPANPTSHGNQMVAAQTLDILRLVVERLEHRQKRQVCDDCKALHLAGGCDVCYAREQARIAGEEQERQRRLEAVRHMRRAAR